MAWGYKFYPFHSSKKKFKNCFIYLFYLRSQKMVKIQCLLLTIGTHPENSLTSFVSFNNSFFYSIKTFFTNKTDTYKRKDDIFNFQGRCVSNLRKAECEEYLHCHNIFYPQNSTVITQPCFTKSKINFIFLFILST